MYDIPPFSMTTPVLVSRFTSGFIASAALITLPLSASALGIQVMVEGESVTFVDVPQTAWFAEYVRSAAEEGIVSGYKDDRGKLTGQFGPANSITMAEALKIAVEGSGYDEELYGSMIESGVTHWASPYISVSRAEDFLLVRNQSRIMWNSPATRAEVASLFTAAFRVDITDVGGVETRYTDVKTGTPYAASIEILSRNEILSGDTDVRGKATGTFRPGDSINRAEVVKIVTLARAKYGTPGADRVPEEEDDKVNDDHIILYGQSGFSPEVLRIHQGESITFKNDGPLPLWVASNPHPLHTGYTGFDVKRSLTKGEIFTFKFDRMGSFGFHNHVHTSHRGTIVVEE